MLKQVIVQPKPLCENKGILRFGQHTIPCALGRSGLSALKREGDGATPIVETRALFGFYRADRGPKPKTILPFTPIRPDMGWCDDITHPCYNRLIRGPFGASHEEMWRQDSLYDLVLVLDINMSERVKGAGSALFMHVARQGYQPTEGCIALKKRDLYRLLTSLDRKSRISIRRQ